MDQEPTTSAPVAVGPHPERSAAPDPESPPRRTLGGRRRASLRSRSRALPAPRRTWRQRLALTTLVLLSVTAMLGTAVVAWGAWKYRSIDRTDVTLDQVVASEPRNYLVVGSDTRAGGDPNDPGAVDDHDPLADTIMVVRVDPAEREAAVLSLPRDLWVTVAGTGDEGRINAAYAAGHQQLIDTLRAELEIPIHHYVEVDFAGFQEVVEAVDGVPVWFDRAMRDRNSGLDVLHPGCTTLDGYGALAFARARHLEYWEKGGFRPDGTGDLGRISRQQVFLRRTITRAKAKGLDNPLTLKRLIDVGTSNVTIDDDLGAGDLLSLAKRFRDFDADELATYTVPTTPRTTSGGAMVLDLAVAEAQPILDLFRDETATGGPSTSSKTSADGAPGIPGGAATGGSAATDVDTTGPDTTDADPPVGSVALVDPAAISVDVYNSARRDGLAVEVADRMVALGFDVDSWGNGADTGHPDEATTVVRYAPSDELVDGENGTDVEAQALTVAAWVASGALVEIDEGLEPGTVAVYLGVDFSELSEPANPSAGGSGGSATSSPTDGSTGTTSTQPTDLATTTTTLGPVPSSEVVGMVPLGDPPPDRECR